jgi:hypothetical protein
MELMPTAALTQLPFKSACEAWLESRRPYISAKTHHEYQLNINTLSAFFGELRLQEIDGDLLRKYQRMRQTEVRTLCHQSRMRFDLPHQKKADGDADRGLSAAAIAEGKSRAGAQR